MNGFPVPEMGKIRKQQIWGENLEFCFGHLDMGPSCMLDKQDERRELGWRQKYGPEHNSSGTG